VQRLIVAQIVKELSLSVDRAFVTSNIPAIIVTMICEELI
jgi:hypothetical protein